MNHVYFFYVFFFWTSFRTSTAIKKKQAEFKKKEIMFVIKRNGKPQPVFFDKITNRLRKLSWELPHVDAVAVAQKVCAGIYTGVATSELDNLAAETSAQMTVVHPEYSKLAGRLVASNIQKETSKSFSETMNVLWKHRNERTDKEQQIINDDVHAFIVEHATELDSAIIHQRDFDHSYFAMKTLQRAYLIRVNNQIVERPQYMFMRVACGIWRDNIGKVLETYHDMSRKFYTHGSPTLFNAGTIRPALSSCFLLTVQEDSIEGIFETLKQCAHISKHAGGIGLNVSNVRAKGSRIEGTNGESDGIVPMLRVFNNVARYVNQSNRRKGSFAVYIEPWHADVFDFLLCKRPHGAEDLKARDLFYGLWIPDLFMKRVEANADWSLMCPNEARGLNDVYGDEFEAMYTQYEKEGQARRTVKAQALWAAIIDCQQETGMPYMLYKDTVNRKNNQSNLGTIKSSNLCTEIVEYTSSKEVACCNLGSIALPKFVNTKYESHQQFADLHQDAYMSVDEEAFDHKGLYDIAYKVTQNLNRVIDATYYPISEAKYSNLKHRPIAVGVQGLADVFLKMKLPYESAAAQRLNVDIFETIYYGALSASCDLAAKAGPYESFEGSPASKGILQFDMWNTTPESGRWDWDGLKKKIKDVGLRNSLLLAPMPTASTSQILGNTESFEPLSNNMYVRRTQAGEFMVVNEYLVRDLMKRRLWSEHMKDQIVANYGSIQSIDDIPDDVKKLYKTVWEIKMKTMIDMAAARGAYIDQSQSFNGYMAEPTPNKLTSMHFYAFKKGLKTGMYYLRMDPPTNADQVTVTKKKRSYDDEALTCSLKNKENCESCSG